MASRILSTLVRRIAELHTSERGEVNASMIAWMVVVVLVIFGFRTQLANLLTAGAGFVTTTLGI